MGNSTQRSGGLRVIAGEGRLSTRALADHVALPHNEVLRRIRPYSSALTDRSRDWIVADTYKDGQGRSRPQLLLDWTGLVFVIDEFQGAFADQVRRKFFDQTAATQLDREHRGLEGPHDALRYVPASVAVAG